MNTFIKTNPNVQKAFAILAIFALAISTFATAPFAYAAVGDIIIGGVTGNGTGPYTAFGTWDTNQPCHNAGGGYRFYIKVIEDIDGDGVYDAGETVLQDINPAPCDGGIFDNTASGNIGADNVNWPANGQSASPATFDLAPGEHDICTVLYHINDNGADTAESTDCLANPVVVDTDDEADIEVVKTVSDDTPVEEDQITYTLTVTNNGPDTATNVKVTDSLPTGVTYISATPEPVDDEADPLTWNFASIVDQGIQVISLTVSVDEGTAGDVIPNTVNASSDEIDNEPDNDESSIDITVQIEGCTDPIANNHDENATVDDGSCDYTCPQGQVGTLPNCVDEETAATIIVKKEVTDGSSTTVAFGINLDDVYQFDLISDESAEIGVTAADGPFKVSEATLPSGWSQISAVCTYPNESTTTADSISLVAGDTVNCVFVNHDANVYGCMDDSFDNYDPKATIDDGSCENDGGGEPTMCTVTVVSNEDDVVSGDSDTISEILSTVNGGWATIVDAFWIWGDDPVVDSTIDETQIFTKTFTWNAATSSIDSADLEIAADNGFKITLNGDVVTDQLGEEFNYNPTETFDVSSYIVEGNNTLVIEVVNMGLEESTPEGNPAGLIYKLEVTGDDESCDDPLPGRYTLDITITGDGSGTVFDDMEGIMCETDGIETDCSETYPEGTVVTLTATPDEGSNFDNSWTVGAGTCTGNNTPCTVTMNSDISLTAHFDLNSGGSSSGGGSSGGGERISLDRGGNDDDDEDEPTPQVLGESTSVIPAGAPNTGFGGTSPKGAELPTLLTLLAMFVAFGTIRATRKNG